MLTQQRLKELLNYNPDTGIFTWIISRGKARSGHIVSCLDSDGYVVVTIDQKLRKAHRLAFLYMDGYLPENQVDHINRIKHDNRYENLREVSSQCQARNKPLTPRNTSGVSGVYWSAADKTWKAGICISHERKHLGAFRDFDEAVYHRYAAEQCIGFSRCDVNSNTEKFILKRRMIQDTALDIWGPV